MNRKAGIVLAGGALLLALLGFALWRRRPGSIPATPVSVTMRIPEARSPQGSPSRVAGSPAPEERTQEHGGLDATRAREILEKIKGRFLESLQGTSQFYTSRFELEADRGIRELRLLCLACPDLAFGMLQAVAEDASVGAAERCFAVQGLGFLAAQGMRSAEDSLYRLSVAGRGGTPDAEVANSALGYLSSCDPNGRYLPLYREKCREGLDEAFWAVQYWNDPTTVGLLEELKREGEGRQGEVYARGVAASLTLEKLSLLADPNGDAGIRRIIEDPTKDSQATLWALRVARMRSYSDLRDLLRSRMGRVESDAKKTIETVYDGVPVERPGLESELARSPHPMGVDDRYFDDILVAYAELGGACSPSETARLRSFGYLGDPRERLEQLIGEYR